MLKGNEGRLAGQLSNLALEKIQSSLKKNSIMVTTFYQKPLPLA